jgi:hypothetical protein
MFGALLVLKETPYKKLEPFLVKNLIICKRHQCQTIGDFMEL